MVGSKEAKSQLLVYHQCRLPLSLPNVPAAPSLEILEPLAFFASAPTILRLAIQILFSELDRSKPPPERFRLARCDLRIAPKSYRNFKANFGNSILVSQETLVYYSIKCEVVIQFATASCMWWRL